MKTRSSHIAFLAPALLLYGAFVILPMTQSAVFSTLDWSGYGDARWVALENYVDLFRDKVFYRAVAHNVALALASVGLQLPMALALALAFQGRSRVSHFLRALVFSPMILPSTVVAVMFMLLFEPLVGPLAQLPPLRQFGFLGNENWAMPLVVVAVSWRHVGFHMMLILAALQGVDRNLYEAAAIDGAGHSRMLMHVTLPAIAPALVLSALLAVLGSLKYFDLVYVMTGGGPNHATELMTTYMFAEGIDAERYGYGAAVAVSLLILSLGCGLAVQRLHRRRTA